MLSDAIFTRYIGGRGIVFDRFLCLYLCFFVSKITRKRMDRFAWNFQGRCGVTMGRHDYIFGQFRETARCRCATRGRGLLCFRTTACQTYTNDIGASFLIACYRVFLIPGFYRATLYWARYMLRQFHPSVCLSHACFVSKRLNISSKFFHYLIGPSF